MINENPHTHDPKNPHNQDPKKDPLKNSLGLAQDEETRSLEWRNPRPQIVKELETERSKL
ncbi:20391_t:CDS:2 [Gigaspora rosea]|nr:20391_t:CDS:2 [Gigaspora rosea]